MLASTTACQTSEPVKNETVEACRTAMAAEYKNQTAWWTLAERPGACARITDEQFARLADEVTGASQ